MNHAVKNVKVVLMPRYCVRMQLLVSFFTSLKASAGYTLGRVPAIMRKVHEECFCQLVEIALAEGAKTARIIPASMVVVDERVRLKCEVPRCAKYNRYLTCPPHVMGVETFSRILSLYGWCLLVQVEAENIDSTDKYAGTISESVLKENARRHHPYQLKLLNVIEMVEKAAFKKGMRFAAGFTGGECVLCDRCVDDKSADACRHPFRARPAMEGVGIDVIQTAQNAGLSIHLSSSEHVLWTGIILLE
jgi:predicted metal-binding protein